MLDRASVLIVVAAATFVAPILFLAALVVAGRRRSSGDHVGPRLTALVTVLGGVSLGLLLLMSGSLIVAWPLLAAVVVLELLLLRRGRLREAGWLLAGTAAPWTVFWGVFLAALYLRLNAFDYWQTWLGFIMGAVPMLFGLIVALARRLPEPASTADLPGAGGRQRSLHDIGSAVRAPAKVRRRVANGDDPVEAGAPLREVRHRLGSRADGQLGRALRGRLVRTLLLVGAGFAGLTLALDYLLPAA